jgi:peptidase E
MRYYTPADQSEEKEIPFYTLSQIEHSRQFDPCESFLVIDDFAAPKGFIKNENFHFQKEPAAVYHLPDSSSSQSLARLQRSDLPKTRYILLNTSMLTEKWLQPAVKPLIDPHSRVCVAAMSYFDDTKSLEDWNRQFSMQSGMFYKAYQEVFYPFRLKPDQIVWINPFTDSVWEMKSKLMHSDILFLPGGAPELFMERLKKNKLASLIKNYSGLVIGVSAGAMILLDQYHITPDQDYPEFSWQKGLGLLSSFDAEVHYHASRIQKKGIETSRSALHRPVYAIYENGGLIVTKEKKENGFAESIKAVGKVDFYE